MSDAYNKIIALMRAQGRGTDKDLAFCAVISGVDPIKLEIMGQEVGEVIFASGMAVTEEDLGRKILCVACDVGLVGVCFF